ncbi:hypothetical protein [Pseudomonas sp. OIL-1]|uniref:hypothetical protein n=1 Tax=Pseudomonas sp. OIL-1 TaxID=2706126 RepID=UPI0013A7A5AD|nr:hypothetical protein [Pseudomonas sp. OIL-1]QIB52136.1 hypothetical protein G3M63_14425 [Pseudomonas sp. OIL-1]
MTNKKATPRKESSPKSSPVKSTLHLDQLKAALHDEMRYRARVLRFDQLQEIGRNMGYTRVEVIAKINELVEAGVFEYQNRIVTGGSFCSPHTRVLVKLAGGEE